jgi:simple sugar transport system permease protein
MSTVSGTPAAPQIGERDEGKRNRSAKLDRRYRLQQSGIDVAILAAVCLAGSVIWALIKGSNSFAFLVHANINTALASIPLLGIPALGVGLLMISGELDISVGANFVFTSIMAAQWTTAGMNEWLAALLALTIGVGIGVMNGLITLRLRIPSFITTLGTTGIWTAAALYFHGESSQTYTPSSAFRHLTVDNVLGIPVAFWWYIVLAVAAWLLLVRHRLGNHMFAAGGNRTAATATGVNVFRAKMVAFAIAGFCAAFGGILAGVFTGDISVGDGDTLPLQAIAACVIGGCLLNGGRGTVLGIFLGGCLIYWIQDVLLLAGAPGFYLTAFVGALVIAGSVIFQNLQARRV